MLEQFLETLQVCERKPRTAKEASSMADDYCAARHRHHKQPDISMTDTPNSTVTLNGRYRTTVRPYYGGVVGTSFGP